MSILNTIATVVKMGQLGIGVMIDRLLGNADSVEAYTAALGKRIRMAELKDNHLALYFTDGSGIEFHDNGQSCCESRYMRTDDDLLYFKNTVFKGAELKEAPSLPSEYSEHDVQFLEIQTGKGVFTMSNHVEHNGYYGGFAIVVRSTQP